MTEVFLEIRGGVLVESYSSDRNILVKVIDWDNVYDGVELPSACPIPCLRLDQMPIETRAAVTRSSKTN